MPYVFASDFVVDGIHYSRSYWDSEKQDWIERENEVSVVQCEDGNKYTGDIVIPETITVDGNTYLVSAIDAAAFARCVELKTIQLPKSITTIGYNAFYNCNELSSVQLPETITRIETRTFKWCYGLSNSFTIPEAIEYIGEEAFKGIEFKEFKSLRPTPPEIDNTAFAYSLKLEVPDADAYRNDSNWSTLFQRIVEPSIEIDGSTYAITSKVNHTCSLEKLAAQPTTTIRIPEKVLINGEEYIVETAEENFLSENTDVEELIIPGTVEALPNDCAFFADLTKLKNLTLEDGETELNLGKSEYYGNCPLETVYLGRNISCEKSYFNSSPFAQKSTLTEVEIGPNVTTLGEYLFNGCNALLTIEGSENVEALEEYAFYGCQSLISAQFNKVKRIGNYAFSECTALTTFESNSVETVGENAFRNDSELFTVSLGDNLKVVEEGAFQQCEKLESVKFGNCITKIGAYSFGFCRNLQHINLSNSLESIGDRAFIDCSKLSGILTIPIGIRVLESNSFLGTNWGSCKLPCETTQI
jgi:hypothetical protein